MRNFLNEWLFLPFRPLFGNMTAPFRPSKEPKASFALLADIHLRREGYRFRRMHRALKNIEKANYIDGLILAGDITDHGIEDQWKVVDEIFSAHRPFETVIVMGNHDEWGDDETKDVTFDRFDRYVEKVFRIKNEKPYFVQQIKGYTFIGLASEKCEGDDVYISSDQISFLDEELKKADKNKPVFVVSHYALNKTHGLPKTSGGKVYSDMTGGIGEKSDEINAVLQKYPNVLLISGHSHMGLCKKKGYSSFEKIGNIHSLNLPYYMFWNHDGLFHCGYGYVFEIYDDHMEIKPRSFLKNIWLPRFNETIYFNQERKI